MNKLNRCRARRECSHAMIGADKAEDEPPNVQGRPVAKSIHTTVPRKISSAEPVVEGHSTKFLRSAESIEPKMCPCNQLSEVSDSAVVLGENDRHRVDQA